MASTNLDSADLKAAVDGGWINQDVMQKIFDISEIPLPFTSRLSSGSVGNAYAEWTQDTLAVPDLTNANVDGADAGTDDSVVGLRVGNHCQISTKQVFVSTRARESDGIGFSDSLAYQLMQRGKEIRRDVEAIMLSQQASIGDDGAAVAGKSAGVGAWLETNVIRGALGASGGYGGTSVGIVDAPTTGTEIALAESEVRDVSELIYNEGGEANVLMTIPGQKRGFSEYLYTSAAKVATLDSDVGQASEMATAKGAVDVFVSDFSILQLVPNRLQQLVEADNCNVYLFDFEFLMQGFLHGYRTEPLGKEGLADRRMIMVDWTLKVLAEKAQGVIADRNPALAVLAVPA